MKVSVMVANYFALIKELNRLDRKKHEIVLMANPGAVHSVTLHLIDEGARAFVKVVEGEACTVTLWNAQGEYDTGLEITDGNIKESAQQIVDYLHNPTNAFKE
jgi:hypothetical protein